MFSDFQKCAKVLALSTCFGFSCNCSTNAMFPNSNKLNSSLERTVGINKVMMSLLSSGSASKSKLMKLAFIEQEIIGEYLVNNKITMIRIVNGENSLSYELYSNNKKVKCLEKSWEEIRDMPMKDNIDKDINDLKYNIDDLLFDCINAAKLAVVSDLVSEDKYNKLISDLVSENKYNFDYIELTLGISLCKGTSGAKRVLRRTVVCKDTTKTDDLPKIYCDLYPELDLLRKKLCHRDFSHYLRARNEYC